MIKNSELDHENGDKIVINRVNLGIHEVIWGKIQLVILGRMSFEIGHLDRENIDIRHVKSAKNVRKQQPLVQNMPHVERVLAQFNDF